MVVTMHIAMLTSIAKLCAVVVAVVVLGGEEEEVVVHDRGSTWVGRWLGLGDGPCLAIPSL